jgi:hypothetical protein
MHAAHPITTVVNRPAVSGAPRQLLVFVKGGGADLETYNPLLHRLLAELAMVLIIVLDVV